MNNIISISRRFIYQLSSAVTGECNDSSLSVSELPTMLRQRGGLQTAPAGHLHYNRKIKSFDNRRVNVQCWITYLNTWSITNDLTSQYL